jgi:DNA-binding MarR family transcriptional regulator
MKSAAAALSASSGHRSPYSLVVRTLLGFARQRSGLDETSCQFVLEWLQTGVAIRKVLQRSLESHGLTELKFSILAALLTLDQNSTMETDLANLACVTRPSVTNALDELQEQRLVARVRDTTDRRIINVHLTKKGHIVIGAALQHYLQTAEHLARFVGKDVQAAASNVSARLRSAVDGTG